jgi:alpha-glucosidase (family GH31 glycosyl hydrolase)
VELEADTTYTVRVAYSMDAPPAIGVNFPNNTVTSLSADVASGLSYFFLVPPSDAPVAKAAGATGFTSTQKDQLIGQYRNLTGQAPLYGRWSVGFVQYVLTLATIQPTT